MPFFKVLLIALLACICFGLAMGTVIVPFAMRAGGLRWLWVAGLLLATLCSGGLLALYLAREDRVWAKGKYRGRL
jgi:hypothetical protein